MYLSLKGDTQTERVIEKSRFITYAQHVSGEEEAKERLSGIRAAHPLATHVCYGYIADKTGNLQRFSDDGEPQGTAGMPILGVIKSQKLFETLVAVVRYFGGIKLGAGGLTRAYAGCAADGLERAEICEYDVCVALKVSVNYSESDALFRAIEGVPVLLRDFKERVEITVAVREGELDAFRRNLQNALFGRAGFRETDRFYYPFART